MSDQLNLKIGADIGGLDKGLQQAEKGIKGLEASVKRSTPAVNQAGQSLTNLGRIASDLPFGFIGIQNNIDPLIQSFGSLSRTSGGVSGALKALGSALIGPAGIGLAFATVSSALTFAVQKYGSFGAAVDAIFGKVNNLKKNIDEAAESYEKFGKAARDAGQIASEAITETSGQVAKVKALVDVLNDSNESYDRRAKALTELQKINKQFFGDLDIEGGKVVGLTAAYEKYVQQIIAAAKAKGFEDELARTNTELAKQQKLLADLVAARTKAREEDRRQAQINAAAANQAILPAGVVVQPRQVTSVVAPEAERQVQAQLKVVNALASSVQQLENGIRETTLATLDLSTAQTTSVGSTRASAAAARDNEREQAKLAATLAAQKKEWDDLQIRLDRLRRPNEADTEITQQFRFENPPEVPQRPFPFNPIDLINAQLQQDVLDQKTLKFNETIKGLAGTFNDLLSPAINTIFGALENGQNVFKALGQSLKALIVNLVATAAKAAILAAIISLIPGGGAALGVAGSVKGGTGNFLNVFKNFLPGFGGAGPGRSAVPSFAGGNLSPSGFQLAGQVVFVQRGTDLVGVLNQGNARIGRVG
jgi:hypothetical protein